MELGARLRQARQEAGLSQRQLCGDRITRNMLSLIENGSASPSMETLRYLAERLGKPMGFFLEAQAVTSPNQSCMERARQASPEQILSILADYQAPDPVFDRERWLMEALACMQLARQALEDGRTAYARQLLEQAAQAGVQTPYFTEPLERQRRLLAYEAGVRPGQLLADFPADDRELYLRAQGALDGDNAADSIRFLEAVQHRDAHWYFLRGQASLSLQDYAGAAEFLLQAVEYAPQKVYAGLERCYRELEDYKQAYFYACKQR